MLSWKRFCLRAVCLLSGLAQSCYSLGSSLQEPCWICGFEVLAEFLYLQPQLTGLGYVVSDDRPLNASSLQEGDHWVPQGTLIGVCPDYEAAFRIGVGYRIHPGCHRFRISYKGLWSRYTESTFAPPTGGLWIVDGNTRYHTFRLNGVAVAQGVPSAVLIPGPEQASANQNVHIEHNLVDALFSSRIRLGRRITASLAEGLRWADICIREDVDYQGVITFLAMNSLSESIRVFGRQFSHAHAKVGTSGIGPLFAANLDVDLGYGLGAGLTAETFLLVGSSSLHLMESDIRLGFDSDQEEFEIDVDLDLRQHNPAHLFPGLDGRLRLKYCCSIPSYCVVSLETGWEFFSFMNCLEQTGYRSKCGTVQNSLRSFNLHGFYLAARLSF